MVFLRCDAEHGWGDGAHGARAEVWTLTAEGGELLRASGWKPYEMHRVSRHVHESLLIDGFLFPGCKTPCVQPASNPILPDIKNKHGDFH